MRTAASSTAIIPYQAPLFGAGAVVAASKKRAFRYLQRALAEPRITINELVWLADDKKDEHGESNKKILADRLGDDECKRLQKHIASLMQYATDHHTSKPRSRHHITRLSMPEYSLFTSRPFSQIQFSELNTWLEERAASLPDNVHILLSTVAVEINKELYNIALYITGGSDAKIHTVVKNQPSNIDFNYESSDLTLFQMVPGKPDDFRPTTSHGQLTESTETYHAITSHPCFNVTVADTQLQVFVEICYDQPDGLALKHLEYALRDESSPTPRYSSSIVTANTTDICQDLCITHPLIHIDSLHSKQHRHYRDEMCLHKVTETDFGGAYGIYDFGTQACNELISDFETHRRFTIKKYYQRKLGVTLSDLDITIEIDHRLKAGRLDDAINLLQLLEAPNPLLIKRLALYDINKLPSLELSYLARHAETLADAQVLQITQRADQLDEVALVSLYELLDDKLITYNADSINALCQQADRLYGDVDLPFFKPALISYLDATSINACVKFFADLGSEILNTITRRFFTAITPSTQHELISLAWLLNTESLATICNQHDSLSAWEINVLCQQVTRLSDYSLSQLLTHSNAFNSESKLLIDNALKHRKHTSSKPHLTQP
ncbi:MAG: hypothetical protein P1U63_10960 [Coxiellaceae bacterium]|nr:hypothetical protein [Coxiellaceae bacterium]